MRLSVFFNTCNDAFHCAAAVFGEITRNGRKQRLEEVVFPQLLMFPCNRSLACNSFSDSSNRRARNVV
ncbi:hypothetical protein KCP74_00295 [Salmonella enterica subsp. enterica]|nr:hypothetical protein KCP74_00295 [Salmonella enterica subsp. enterica]